MSWKQVILISVVWIVAGGVVCMGKAPSEAAFGSAGGISVLIFFFGGDD